MSTSTTGIIPAPETLLAWGIIITVYLIRVASIGADPSWLLRLTTDMLIPLMAGAWVFVSSVYGLIVTFDERVATR